MSLEHTFDLPTQKDIEELEGRLDVALPENATLRDVARLALDAYKKQMEEIHRIEPRYRARAFECAQLYLQVAQEAIGKDADLNFKREKLAPAGNENAHTVAKKNLLDELAEKRQQRQREKG